MEIASPSPMVAAAVAKCGGNSHQSKHSPGLSSKKSSSGGGGGGGRCGAAPPDANFFQEAAVAAAAAAVIPAAFLLYNKSSSTSSTSTIPSNSIETVAEFAAASTIPAPKEHFSPAKVLQSGLSSYDKLIRAGRIKDSLEVLQDLDKRGVLDMNKVYHVRFFQECKKQRAVEEAFGFSQLITSPTISTFNSLLSVCCGAADTDGAFGAFNAMKQAGFRPDCMIYTTLLSTCAKAHKMDLLFQVFYEMESAGVEGNVHTYGAMIDGCARAGDVAKAFGLYGSMLSKNIKPDVVIFNSLINSCARTGAVQRAFEVFSEMKSANVSFRPNHVTMCSLIDACSRAGEVDSAYEVYAIMRKSGIKSSPGPYTAAVHACSHNGDLERALSIFSDLQNDNVKPDEVFFSALIDVAGHAKRVDKAFEILGEVEKHSIVPGATIISSLMGVCSNTGNWEKALVLHQTIQELGVRPTTSTLNALITALCRGNKLHDAVRCLAEMQEAGVPANDLTFSLLLEACEKENASEIALNLYQCASTQGFPPSLSMCSSMIGLCFHGIHKGCLPPVLDPPLGPTRPVNEKEKPHQRWVSWALAVYRQAVSTGITPTKRLFSQVLGCLRLPDDQSVKFSEENSQSNARVWSMPLVDGFGVYDPRASALYEEAAAFGIVPIFQCDSGSITFHSEALPLFTAEVCLLTILKALKHRCAIDAQLPSVTIHFDTQSKTVTMLDGHAKDVPVSGRTGQAIATLLRRLRLRYSGKESSGRIRISSATLVRWFRPSSSASATEQSVQRSALLGKSIVEQQRAIRMQWLE